MFCGEQALFCRFFLKDRAALLRTLQLLPDFLLSSLMSLSPSLSFLSGEGRLGGGQRGGGQEHIYHVMTPKETVSSEHLPGGPLSVPHVFKGVNHRVRASWLLRSGCVRTLRWHHPSR